jgi:hypothetical protein
MYAIAVSIPSEIAGYAKHRTLNESLVEYQMSKWQKASKVDLKNTHDVSNTSSAAKRDRDFSPFEQTAR